jgi:hypothetical protein
MLKVETDVPAGYLELTVDGAVDKEDYRLLQSHAQLNVVEVVRNIGWIEPEIWWKDLLFHLAHRNFIHRAAVVSDSGWVGPVTRIFAPFYPAAIRTFGLDQLEHARQWAKVGDVNKAAD